MTAAGMPTSAIVRPYAPKRAHRLAFTIAESVAARLLEVPAGHRSAFVEAAIAAALERREREVGGRELHPSVRVARVALHLQEVAQQLLGLSGEVLVERSRHVDDVDERCHRSAST